MFDSYFETFDPLANLTVTLNMLPVAKVPEISRVIYNGPCTIVFWTDNTKTVVRCNNEDFDKEKGLAMAFCKKVCGNNGNYFEMFKQWAKED